MANVIINNKTQIKNKPNKIMQTSTDQTLQWNNVFIAPAMEKSSNMRPNAPSFNPFVTSFVPK